MTALLAVLRGFVSANGLTVALLAGAAVTLTTCDWRAAKRGRAEAVQQINTQTGALINDALEARLPAARPGAAERLRDPKHCRDC